MVLRDFDIEMIRYGEIVYDEKNIFKVKVYLTRTNFVHKYYNDFKKYPSKKYPYFILCYRRSDVKYISLHKTEEDAYKFFNHLIEFGNSVTKEELYKYLQANLLKNRQPRYKYGRF